MRGEITVKDLAVETNINGNYVVYFQHTQEGHKTPVELRPIPSLVNQMCLVYDAASGKFVPQDLATYVENTPSFENKIREVAGTAELVVADGSAVIAKVTVYDDSTYLPLTGNNAGDQAFATDTDILYIWDGSAWQQAGAANSDDLTEGSTNLFFTDARVTSYLSSNDFDTATNIVASITDSAPATLDTLNELAAALGDDPNFATTTANNIATKLAITDFTSTADTWIGTKNTGALSEGSNLYYTNARADARIALQAGSNLDLSGKSTSDLSEGANLYYTDARADARITASNTDALSEGSTNLYYTDARVKSSTITGGSLRGTVNNTTVQYATSYSGTPAQGSFFFDSLNQKLKVYTGSAFVDAVPAGSGGGGGGETDANATFVKYTYTITSSTNSVSGSDDASETLTYTTGGNQNVEAYVNGVKQTEGASNDYVATTGSSVVFTYNIPAGSVVDIQVYELLTNDAYYLKTETYTQAQVNSQISTGVSSYLPLTGGVLTNDLAINNGSPELYFGTTGNHYNWRIAAQEAVDAAFEIAVGSQDTDYSNDTYTPKLVVKANGSVGIGTTAPLSQLQVGDSTAVSAASRIVFGKSITASQSHLPVIQHSSTNGLSNDLVLAATSGDGAIRFYTGGSSYSGNFGGSLNSERLRIDKDGDVGIGRIPAEWNTSSGYRHINLGNSAWLRADTDSSNNFLQTGVNAVRDATAWKFEESGYATNHFQGTTLGHTFATSSVSGTAGGTISWVDHLVINTNGNVGIGTTNPLAPLHVNGNIVVGSGDSNQKIYLEGAVNDLNMIHRNTSENTTIMTARHAMAFIIDSNADDSDSGSGHFTVRKNGTTVAGSDEMFKILPNGDASFHGNHLQLPKSATNPTGTSSGQLYYDTANNAVKFYDGSTWRLVNEIGVRVTSFDVFGDSSSVALYQLNANGNDTGGNYNLTINGSSFGTGKFGNAWNGTGSNAAYSTASGLNVSGDYSVSFWYKSSTTSQGNKRLVTLKGTNVTAGWNNYNGSLGFYIGGVYTGGTATSVTRVSQIPDAQVNDGSWHHLAFSVTSSGSWVIYLDGTSYSGAVSGEGRSFNNNNYLAITNYDSGTGYNTTGLVDQLRIFNRVITAGEVTQLYNTSG
jgi:hypothetical protein